MNYNYPSDPSQNVLQNTRFVPLAHPLSEKQFKDRKKHLHEMLNVKYEEIMGEADALLRNQKKSFFSRITNSFSNFFYGLIGKKAPMPTPICNRFEPLLKDLNNKMFEYYLVAGKGFTENEINREFPKMKELAQRFRHKFTFQGGNPIPSQAPEEQHQFRF